MSQVVDQARGVYDKLVGNNTQPTTVGGSLYTGPNSYPQGSNAAYTGQSTYSNIPQDYKYVNQTFQTSTGYSRLGQSLTQKVVAEQIPVESRIQYIPFEKKYIEYDQVERIERVPYEREIVEYEEVTRTERIPIERTITDYYAVETQIEYIPKEIEQTIVEYEPIERVYERVQYLPVETQIVHYPERDNYVSNQSQFVGTGYTTGYTQGVNQTSYISGNTTNYVQSGYPIETGYTYVPGVGQSGVRAANTQYVSYTGGQAYVAEGSGVRENVYKQSQTGYVTGGSGVRQ